MESTTIPDTVPQERTLVTEIPGPRSRALSARRARAVPAGVGTTLPVFVARAGGGILEDVDGNRLIDFGSGISVTNVGNSAPRVVAAVTEQARRFTHTCFQVTPYEGYLEVCERLNALTPGTHDKRTFLVNSGAEAVENAVKVARYATGRPAVVAFDHGFHGRTLLTMSLTGKAMPYKQGFGPFVGEVVRVTYSDPFRKRGRLDETLDLLETTVGAHSIACVVVEPIAGEGGFVVPETGWLRGLAEWCSANGVVFVADEVQTGFGRTGMWFACEHEGVVPDIVTTAKSLGGGLPIAAVTGRAELMDTVHPGGLGTTFGGNPLSCAAALAAIDTIEADGLLARARRLGALMSTRLQALASAHPMIGEARGRGAMVAIEFVGEDGSTPDKAAALRVASACHAEGMVVLTAGTYGNVIRLLPPLVMPDHLAAEGLDILERAVAAA
ncbi:MAG TPA: 4-aminobutyrate--2-oxoglutarate transaminase [Acidimicrobiales bacterium]|nr:4-aminobutyrate--2-oxoglutarate transaminase [Acidimicrobiales bacterium]